MIWKVTGAQLSSALPTGLHGKEKSKLDYAGHILLHDTVDALISTEVEWGTKSKPDGFPSMKMKYLYAFVMSTLPGVAKLKF